MFLNQFRKKGFERDADHLLVRDTVPKVRKLTAVCNIMQLKLNFACQTLCAGGGGIFSGARHRVMQRKISTLRQLAEAAQYCNVKDSSSVQ